MGADGALAHEDELLVGGALVAPRSDNGVPCSPSSLTALSGRIVLPAAVPPAELQPDEDPSRGVVSVVLDTRSDSRKVSPSDDVMPAASPKPEAEDSVEEDVITK